MVMSLSIASHNVVSKDAAYSMLGQNECFFCKQHDTEPTSMDDKIGVAIAKLDMVSTSAQNGEKAQFEHGK